MNRHTFRGASLCCRITNVRIGAEYELKGGGEGGGRVLDYPSAQRVSSTLLFHPLRGFLLQVGIYLPRGVLGPQELLHERQRVI